jgi:CRISPR-associated endonuclease Csn1
MTTKKVLGLDLGTNSIGWAVVNNGEEQKSISCAGSRIIPMDAALQGDFESGNSISQTADRTKARGVRRLFERRALRRERLNRVLSIMGFLPEHYAKHLNRYGQLNRGVEPKLAWEAQDGKSNFLFQSSFNEMTAEFASLHPELLATSKKIPYDWTIYYLRKKALTQAITKQELAWILHQFNQKRGYYQARGEEDETETNKKKEWLTLKVISVRDTGEVSKGRTWYEVTLENGWIYKRQSAYPLDWEGKTRDFIVTTTLNTDGTEAKDASGNIKRTLSAPKEDDWGLRKIKTESEIEFSGKTIGEFIYDNLLQNPDQKILGELVRVVDRKFYKEELYRILEMQKQFIAELQDSSLYISAIEALYPQNQAYRESISGKDFTYLLLQDIIFYQRPLKSKKSLISECPYEYRVYKDSAGKWQREYIKCISKSHPLYEEFRIWQFVENLHIYRIETNGISKSDCTAEYISDKAQLVDWLLTQKEVSQTSLLKQIAGKQTKGLKWNYVEDKKYPMAPVTSLLTDVVCEAGGNLSNDELVHIWHILYSVSDKVELVQALTHYVEKHQLSNIFVEKLSKVKPFAADYGAYSEKAIRRLLSIMRSGKYWNVETIDTKTQERIAHILTGEVNSLISNQVRDKLQDMNQLEDFQGLPLWLAEYVVYDVRRNDTKWEKPEDIDTYLQEFRLHSLNNPIVEQVVKESLRTVRDIWKQEGHIDEIHLELGRNLKQNAEQRKRTLANQMENEKANWRAKLLLQAFMNPEMDIENVRPHSPSQQELFRIYEDGVLSVHKADDDINRIIQSLAELKQPSPQDVKKYRLWLDQKYQSPYTGQIIPLSKLFTPAYQIEHIIPQSRFFDDSMSNKVICEAEVNARKDRMLAHEFIDKCGGETITLSGGKVVSVLTKDEYERLVKELFSGNKSKHEKLMLDDIPEKFIARQMNDSRYISRLMMRLLSNIVREQNANGEYEAESTSKNLIVCNGATTTRLKKDWGINDVWNRIILPRFERMNALKETDIFTTKTTNGHIIPNMPLELSKGFEKKRIDHRHHAMDAIVIAFTTRNHVSLLSNENALDKNEQARYDLQVKLRKREKWQDKNGKEHTKFTDFISPYDGFQQDVYNTLENIVVSFKQNLRVLNKSNNKSVRIVDGKKKMVPQTKGDNWAIRKSLHKDTVFGEINLQRKKFVNLTYALQHINDIVEKDLRYKLRELVTEGKDEKQIKKYFASEPDVWADVNLKKIEVYYYTKETNDRFFAVRTTLGEAFTADYIRNKVADSGIQKILLAHLDRNNSDAKQAFSPDGIEQMNADIQMLNNGIPHKPIKKVRVYEKAEKFAVGELGSKSKKFVEAAKGTNLFFAIYESISEDGNRVRSFVSVPLRMLVDCQKADIKHWKQQLDHVLRSKDMVPSTAQIIALLSPGDLVYVPTKKEIATKNYSFAKDRIYKVVSSTGNRAFFILSAVASPILDKEEYSALNKMERAITGEMIKEICVPIKVDRLGNIL